MGYLYLIWVWMLNDDPFHKMKDSSCSLKEFLYVYETMNDFPKWLLLCFKVMTTHIAIHYPCCWTEIQKISIPPCSLWKQLDNVSNVMPWRKTSWHDISASLPYGGITTSERLQHSIHSNWHRSKFYFLESMAIKTSQYTIIIFWRFQTSHELNSFEWTAQCKGLEGSFVGPVKSYIWWIPTCYFMSRRRKKIKTKIVFQLLSEERKKNVGKVDHVIENSEHF